MDNALGSSLDADLSLSTSQKVATISYATASCPLMLLSAMVLTSISGNGLPKTIVVFGLLLVSQLGGHASDTGASLSISDLNGTMWPLYLFKHRISAI